MATLLLVGLASLVLFIGSVAAMAIGVMLRRPCLRGSCGGPALRDADGERLSCANCPRRDADHVVAPSRDGDSPQHAWFLVTHPDRPAVGRCDLGAGRTSGRSTIDAGTGAHRATIDKPARAERERWSDER